MADHVRLAPATLLLAVTLAAVPLVLPGSLLVGSAPTAAETRPAGRTPGPPRVVRLRSGSLPLPVSPEASHAIRAHTVAAGDTLWAIAEAAGVDVAALAEANHVSESTVLHPGQVLTVPVPPPAAQAQPAPRTSSTHTVAAGDTLWTIAEAAGVDVAALAEANHVSESAALHPGQVLAVPASGTAEAGSSVKAPRANAPAEPRTHTVAPGDSLWAVARSSGVSVASLAAANHLKERATLHLGQVLTVPAPGVSAPRPAVSPGTTPRPALASPRVVGRGTAPRGTASSGTRPTLAEHLRMLWPASGMVTSRFGWRIHPIFRTREFHTGLDIATRWGAPVLAARTGVVRFAGWRSGYGRLIVLDHGGGLETTYSHLSTTLVRVGQLVTRGQEIGRIGSTGWSTGPHLLFEVRQDGVPVDPTRYLN